MIQTTPQQPQQDPYLEILNLLKEVKELGNTSSFSCADCGDPPYNDQYQLWSQNNYEPNPSTSFDISGLENFSPPQSPVIRQYFGKTIAELLAEEQAALMSAQTLIIFCQI